MSIPIIADDSVPPGAIFMLPPDVMRAMYQATAATARAYEAMLDCWLVAVTFDDPNIQRLLLPDLMRKAERTAKAATYAMAGAMMIIEAAGRENRIGCITNIKL